jgi:hypothetical protein
MAKGFFPNNDIWIKKSVYQTLVTIVVDKDHSS